MKESRKSVNMMKKSRKMQEKKVNLKKKEIK